MSIRPTPEDIEELARLIEIRDSAHLFLKQSVFAERLRTWIDGKKDEWPQLVTSIAYKWLDEGLQDRGITRDLAWGVPVPDDIAAAFSRHLEADGVRPYGTAKQRWCTHLDVSRADVDTAIGSVDRFFASRR